MRRVALARRSPSPLARVAGCTASVNCDCTCAALQAERVPSTVREQARRLCRCIRRVEVLVSDVQPYLTGMHGWASLKVGCVHA